MLPALSANLIPAHRLCLIPTTAALPEESAPSASRADQNPLHPLPCVADRGGKRYHGVFINQVTFKPSNLPHLPLGTTAAISITWRGRI